MTAGHRRAAAQPGDGKDALRGLALLVLLVVGLGLLVNGCNDPDVADADAAASSAGTGAAAPVDSGPHVPDVSGMQLDLALAELGTYQDEHDVDGYPRSHDLSPRGRGQWQNENWTVVTTRPVAGAAWEDETELHVFVLRNAEWAWFQAHPVMPVVPVDLGPSALTEPAGLLDGMAELVEYRYAPGEEPDYASLPYARSSSGIEGLGDDPSLEPASERAERDVLAQASEYGTLTVGSLPAVDVPLRVGQLVTVTVREEPREPVPTYSGGDTDVSGSWSYSGGDDDVNVPGWLCPTRFC